MSARTDALLSRGDGTVARDGLLARLPVPPLWALLVAVVLPPLAYAGTVLLERDAIAFGGDQAVIELAVREALEGDRTLGPYSRYGWSHPGPAWFYLLAVPYRLLGASSAALYLAVLLLHAVSAVLVVVAVERWAGRRVALVATAAVLLAFGVLGADVFRSVWNPYALLLPLVLFLVLAAASMTGSIPALAAAALVATFLAQTHVGAAVPVAAVSVLAAVCCAVAVRRRRARPDRRTVALVTGLGLLTLAAWLPPAVQELRPGTGNVGQMRLFAELELPGQTLAQAAATVGSELLVLPSLGQVEQPPEATAALDAVELVALGTFAATCIAVVVVGRRRRRPFPAALAAASLVLAAASVAAVTEIESPVHPYLVVWQSVLPVPLVVALAALGTGAVRRARPRRAAATPVVAAGALVGVLAAVLAPPLAADSAYGAAQAVDQVVEELAPPSAGPVRVRIASSASWPMASGVVLALQRRGYDVRVTADWTFMFGLDLLATGREPSEVLLVQQADLAKLPPLPGAEVLRPVEGEAGRTVLAVRRTADGGPVPELPGPVTGKLIPA